MSLQTKTGLFSMEAFHTKTPVSTMSAGFCGCSCGCGCACLTCCAATVPIIDPATGQQIGVTCISPMYCVAGCGGTCAF